MILYNVILVIAIILAPLASVRIANAIYRERKISFLNTEVIVKRSLKTKNKSVKKFLIWLADFCDCPWCVSYISAIVVIVLSFIWITQLIVILFGLSELTILLGNRFHE